MGYKLLISGIVPESIVDGPGIRYVIFTQGCPHRCKGCHNPQTHDFDSGEEIEIDKIFADICENPLLGGVTFSGGEPFCQAAVLAELAKKIKAAGKNIMVYSGYTLEQLMEMGKDDESITELLRLCDTLVDGRYEEENRDLTLTFMGSRNQRLIDLKQMDI